VLRDQLAFDFCLCCQTELELYRGRLNARFRATIRRSRPNGDLLPRAMTQARR
jgi:hypothetical protein